MMQPPQGKTRGKTRQKTKSEKYNVVPSENGRTYGIDHLNLGKPANDSESDPQLLLAQLREDQIANKRYNNITKRECNVLFNFENP